MGKENKEEGAPLSSNLDEVRNEIDSTKWYGCIVLDEELSPILFPLNREGGIMEGAGIEDHKAPTVRLGRGGMAIVQCQFKKDGEVISPETASEEYKYKDIEFNTMILSTVSVYGLIGKLDNVWGLYEESTERFKTMLDSCVEEFLEEENPDKKYLAFSVYETKDESQSLYVINKLGKMYPKFKFKGGKEGIKENLNQGEIYEVQFQDGTLPITLKQASGRAAAEPDNIFLSAALLGSVKLRDNYKFTTWEEALEKDYDNIQLLMKHSMFALKKSNDNLLEKENKEK